jgi:hypothetical protein
VVLGEERRGIIDAIGPIGVMYVVVNLPLVKSWADRNEVITF